jgi:hypothetical protein
MLLLNTAPQFVGASNTLHKTNIVETQSHYVDTIGLGVDLCTGLMACSLTSVAHTADVDQTLLQNLYTLRLSVVEPHAQGIC